MFMHMVHGLAKEIYDCKIIDWQKEMAALLTYIMQQALYWTDKQSTFYDQ